MKVLIIHLSDIHFKHDVTNSIESKLDNIKKTISHSLTDINHILIAISGDVAFSGKEEEYLLAEMFIDEIQDYLLTHFERFTNKISIISVPGNHDCDFNIGGKLRETSIKFILTDGEDAIDDGVLGAVTSVQSEYFKFHNKEGFKDNGSALFWQKIIDLSEDQRVVVNCYNTAFLSTLDEKQGSLFFPMKYLNKEDFKDSKADIVISMFHHPKGWLNSNNARSFFNHIEKTSDFVLTGHEHVNSKSMKDDLNGSRILFVEGSVLQESKDDKKSGFNLILVDLDAEKLKIENCLWNGEQYTNNLIDSEYIDYKHKLGKFKNEYDFEYKFIEWLVNPGATFSHPYKERILINDIFIYPNLRCLNKEILTDKEEFQSIESSDNIFKGISNDFKFLISGSENSGKTTLSKVIIRDLHDQGYIPIYLDGTKLKSTSIEDFVKVARKSFSEQYSNKNEQSFENTPKDKLVFLIDDFDKFKVNSKYKYKLLNALTVEFSNVIIIGNELFKLEEVVHDDTTADDVLVNFVHYEVLEFGHKLRAKLVNKWNTLGNIETLNEDERHRKNDSSQRIINSIIGPNLIPSYPLFLLTILQTIEAGNPHSLKESSYGHYYQVLITSALGKLVKKNDEIDKYYSYLAEFAYYLFDSKFQEIDEDDYDTFHSSHCAKYKIKFSIEEAKNTLFNASILECYDSVIKFKYKYIYYFFIAKYFADNLWDDEIKKEVSMMCRRLHQAHFANIILFLTHHSKDKFILDEVLAVAKEQFSDNQLAAFDKDISNFNSLISEAPSLILKEKNIDEHREEVLHKKDLSENGRVKSTETENTSTVGDGVDDLDIVSKLNTAFKTLEIAGQILKNHYATIVGENKVALAEEAYYIGLRTLNSIYKEFEKSSEYLINHIQTALEKIENPNKDKIEQVAKRIVFQLIYSVSLSFIRKVAVSVGSEKLQEVFNEVKEKNDINSVHLIDFAISTEFYQGISTNNLKKLAERFKDNPLALTILRRIVINYLYLYPVKFDKKQQICSTVGISMQTQRLIENTSSVRKK